MLLVPSVAFDVEHNALINPAHVVAPERSNQLLGRVQLTDGQKVLLSHCTQLIGAKRDDGLRATRGRDEFNLKSGVWIDLDHGPKISGSESVRRQVRSDDDRIEFLDWHDFSLPDTP